MVQRKFIFFKFFDQIHLSILSWIPIVQDFFTFVYFMKDLWIILPIVESALFYLLYLI